MNVALVNTNRIKPPIAPIGMEYVAESLRSSGFNLQILDLCWEEDTLAAISDFFHRKEYDLIGVTLRNTDDCAYTSRQSFVPDFARLIDVIKDHSDALVVAGGVGFSVMPEKVMEVSNIDVGVWGDGEFVFPELAKRIRSGEDWRDLPNLVWRRDGKWVRNSPRMFPLSELPQMSRRLVDNQRYFQEGGQGGIETRRGCPQKCIYCADPLAKGAKLRVRPPADVADELENLLRQGIDHIHTCDCEFNIPEHHAMAVCRELIRRNLGNELRWYAYCAPSPFSAELAGLMKRAGCVGINFGTDSGDEGMLRKLKRDYTPDHIADAVKLCKKENIIVMLDLMIGAPGESRQSIKNTIDLMKKTDPHRIGFAIGVRVYPGTPLEEVVKREEYRAGLQEADEPRIPMFFMEPSLTDEVFSYLDGLIGSDERFLFFDPANPDKNYNYNANQRLVEAIRKGYRGAYWDILRLYR